MARTAMVRARTDPRLKTQVENIFRKLGLSSTEAINLFYHQVKIRKGLPFRVEIPNEETRKTLEGSARGEGIIESRDADDLFKKLDL